MGYKNGKKFWANSNSIDKVYINSKKDIVKSLQAYFDKNRQPCKYCKKHIKVVDCTLFFLTNSSVYDEEVIYTDCGCGKSSVCIPFIEIGGCYCYATS